MKGCKVWKNLGSNSIGKVPPEPATCKTRITMDKAWPTLPKAAVRA